LLFYCPSQAFWVGTNYILTRQTPWMQIQVKSYPSKVILVTLVIL
jgi:hypothetical protein